MIKLNNRYYIDADSHQYLLLRKSEKGKQTITPIGYYGSITRLAKAIIEKEIKTGAFDNLEELMIRIDELAVSISNQLLEYGVDDLLQKNIKLENEVKELKKLLKKQNKEGE